MVYDKTISELVHGRGGEGARWRTPRGRGRRAKEAPTRRRVAEEDGGATTRGGEEDGLATTCGRGGTTRRRGAEEARAGRREVAREPADEAKESSGGRGKEMMQGE